MRRRWGERDNVTDTRAWEWGEGRTGRQPYLDNRAEDEHDEEDEGEEPLEDVHDDLFELFMCLCVYKGGWGLMSGRRDRRS